MTLLVLVGLLIQVRLRAQSIMSYWQAFVDLVVDDRC